MSKSNDKYNKHNKGVEIKILMDFIDGPEYPKECNRAAVFWKIPSRLDFLDLARPG